METKSPTDPTFALSDLWPLAVKHNCSLERLHKTALRVAAAAAAARTPFRPAAVAEALGFGPVGAVAEPLAISAETGSAVDAVSNKKIRPDAGFGAVGGVGDFRGETAGSVKLDPGLKVFGDGDVSARICTGANVRPRMCNNADLRARMCNNADLRARTCNNADLRPLYTRRYASRNYYTSSGTGGGSGRRPPPPPPPPGATDCGGFPPGSGCGAPDGSTEADRWLCRRVEDVRCEGLRNHSNNRLLILELATELKEAKAKYTEAVSTAKRQVGVIGFRMFLGLGAFSFLSMTYYLREFNKLPQPPLVLIHAPSASSDTSAPSSSTPAPETSSSNTPATSSNTPATAT